MAQPPRIRIRSTWSVPLNAYLAMLLVGVVGLMVVSLVVTFKLRDSVEVDTQARTEVTAIAASTATLLDAQLDEQLNALRMLAADPSLIADLTTGQLDALTRRLEAMGPAHRSFSRIAVIAANGRVVANSVPDKTSLGIDFGSQPHGRAALLEQRAAIGVPRLSLGQPPAVPLAPIGVPIITSEGRTIGLVQATIGLDRLNAAAATVHVNQTGYITVEAPDGMVVSHPDASRLL